MRLLIALLIVTGVAGCQQMPAGVVWSPDGHAGVYQQGVVDSAGKESDKLPPFSGPSAWSGDSKCLYYSSTSVAESGEAVTPLRRWVDGKDADANTPPPKVLPAGYPRTAIYCRYDGKTNRVVTLWQMYIGSLAVSGDQKWLLIEASNINGSLDFREGLLALQLQSKKVFVVTPSAGPYCFTSNDRIAFESFGQVQEATLDESVDSLNAKSVLAVLPYGTQSIAGNDKALLLLTAQRSFPAPATQPTELKIYSVQRDNLAVKELAGALFETMQVSPDGKRVLFFTSTDQHTQLSMMNVDGSQKRALMDLSTFNDGLPIAPTWHGDDRITFASTTGTEVPAKEKEFPHRVYDVVDYTIPANAPMTPLKTLSQDWPVEKKPYCEIRLRAQH